MSDIYAMTYSELRYWDSWHGRMTIAEENAARKKGAPPKSYVDPDPPGIAHCRSVLEHALCKE